MPRRCRICKTKFEPTRAIQPTCTNYSCMVEYADRIAEKSRLAKESAERKQIRARKMAMKTARSLAREAQIAFNAYIRARDSHLPCICCGKPLPDSTIGGGYDCGHYRSVGSAPHLRFDERNAHGQRKQCNRYGAGRAVDYRIGLIARIGLDAVESLEADNVPKKYTREDLKAIKNEYTKKRRELIANAK